MVKSMIVDTFKVTETLQNGKERTTKKQIYSEAFIPCGDGKRFYGQNERVRDCMAVLKECHYYNIEYVGGKMSRMLFTDRDTK